MSDTFGREIPYEIMFSKNDSPLPEKISSPNTTKRFLNIQFRNKNITVYYLSFTFNEIHLFNLLQLHLIDHQIDLSTESRWNQWNKYVKRPTGPVSER